MLRKREAVKDEGDLAKEGIRFDLDKAIQELDKIERELDYKKRELNKVQADIDNISDQMERDFGVKDIKELEGIKKQMEIELQKLTNQIGKEYEELMDLLNGRGMKI